MVDKPGKHIDKAYASGLLTKPEHRDKVNAICEDYPYFQAAQLLRAALDKKSGASQEEIAKKIGLFLPHREVITHLAELFLDAEGPQAKTASIEDDKNIEVKPAVQSQQDQNLGIKPSKEPTSTKKRMAPSEKKPVTPKPKPKSKQNKTPKTPDSPSKPKENVPATFLEWLEQKETVNSKTKPTEKGEREKSKEDDAFYQTMSPVEVEATKQSQGLDNHVMGFLNEQINQKRKHVDLDTKESIEDTSVSETLAEILWKQGQMEKAIAMYKKLELKYPQKSRYFANRIKTLKNNP